MEAKYKSLASRVNQPKKFPRCPYCGHKVVGRDAHTWCEKRRGKVDETPPVKPPKSVPFV